MPGPTLAQRNEANVIAYVTADIDGDRLLNFEEFRVFVGLMAEHGRPAATRIRAFGAYRIAFRRVDVDGNGLATPDEIFTANRDYLTTGE